MAKANKKSRLFIKRGETTSKFIFEDEEIEIDIVIPTNYENDKLIEEYSVVTHSGMDVRGADLLETRLLMFVKDLSFEIPLDKNLEKYGSWIDANEDQKRLAIRLMDPDLRDLINEKLLGKITLSEDVKGN